MVYNVNRYSKNEESNRLELDNISLFSNIKRALRNFLKEVLLNRHKMHDLLEELFAIGSNHKVEELNAVRQKMVEYSKTDNDVLIRDAICFIDAVINLFEVDERKEAYKIMAPVFERLVNKDKWSFYDITLSSLCTVAETFEEAYISTQQALNQIDQYSSEPRYKRLKLSLLRNLCERLLIAKYKDPHYVKQGGEIENIFAEYIEKALDFSETVEDKTLGARLLVHKGIFYKDLHTIDEGMKVLETLHDDALYEMMEEEIKEYLK